MPTCCFDFFWTGPSRKGGGEKYRPDHRQPHRSPESSPYPSIRHRPPSARQPAHLRIRLTPQHHSTQLSRLPPSITLTGKRYLHGHTKPLDLTINPQMSRERMGPTIFEQDRVCMVFPSCSTTQYFKVSTQSFNYMDKSNSFNLQPWHTLCSRFHRTLLPAQYYAEVGRTEINETIPTLWSSQGAI